MKNNLNIEELFKSKFDSYEIEPSHNMWNKISQKMRIRDFFKFIPRKFNIYYLITSLIVITGSIILYNNDSSLDYSNITDLNPENKTVIYEKEILTSDSDIKDNKIKEPDLKNNQNSESEVDIINKETIIENTKSELEIEVKEKSKKEEKNVEIKVLPTDIETEDSNNFKDIKKFTSAFESDVEKGCMPLTVCFKNQTKYATDFVWNFGNKEKSSLKNPEIVFEEAGTYKVTLTSSYKGIVKTSQRYITVYENPVADFIVSNQNNLFARSEISFANVSANYHKCKWIFGDNTFSTLNHPSHLYKNKGIYEIKLIAYTENGCADSTQERSLFIEDSKYEIGKPTAFTPNIYGENEGYWQTNRKNNNIFYLIFAYEVAEYELIIMNKWGKVVFKTNDPKKGWNGYYRNSLSEHGVYVWKCYGKFIDGEVFNDTGNITLLHSER